MRKNHHLHGTCKPIWQRTFATKKRLPQSGMIAETTSGVNKRGREKWKEPKHAGHQKDYNFRETRRTNVQEMISKRRKLRHQTETAMARPTPHPDQTVLHFSHHVKPGALR